MKLSFDYFHNLVKPDFYLLNPDETPLYCIITTNRHLVLRFNDTSELTFTIYSQVTDSDGNTVQLPYYDLIQTRRLIEVDNVGKFVIKNVVEEDNGVTKLKNVTCRSLQETFRDRGFATEERVYKFYSAADPTDSNYNPDNESSVPTIVGQLYQQLGINCNLTQGRSEPSQPFADWTITYITNSVQDEARSFDKNTTFGYDFMVQDAAKAFEAIFLFDFYYKTIHVLTVEEVTSKANVIYSFNNFMQNVEIEEDAENIITVLTCNGNNCDITSVNPMGTNYICDFSYYMDDSGKWMSDDLIAKIEAWQTEYNTQKDTYTTLVQQLQTLYSERAVIEEKLTNVSEVYTDLLNAQKNKAVALVEDPQHVSGIIWDEIVNVGGYSIDPDSIYRASGTGTVGAFQRNSLITAYKAQPNYVGARWFPDDSEGVKTNKTASECYSAGYLYFFDTASPYKSYCMLKGEASVDSQTQQSTEVVAGFDKYSALGTISTWVKRYDSLKKTIQSQLTAKNAEITTKQAAIKAITDQVNILKYFSSYPALFKELTAYWIEGDYTNENIAILENTSDAQAIDLAQELMDTGAIELAKVCQPKIQFSLTSVDCMKQYEFRNQMKELELGKIITVEKEEGIWYYPALLEMEYDLDNSESFGLTFANSLRLDDWGFTFADLISESSATSKKVSANWQNFNSYTKDKPSMVPLIQEPLSMTLRSAFANMTNQEFIIDETGILGRKFVDSTVADEFEDEQLRMSNNLLIFTDDSWNTARMAVGKVTIPDGQGGSTTAYGVIADVIVGTLVMSETLYIKNSNSSVIIDGSGISIIKKTSGQADVTVFHAGIDGSMDVTSSATLDNGSTTLSQITTNANNITTIVSAAGSGSTPSDFVNYISTIKQEADQITAKVDITNNNTTSGCGWSLTSSAFNVFSVNQGVSTTVLSVTDSGLTVNGTGTFNGTITATAGHIGDWSISSHSIGTSSTTPGEGSFYLASASSSGTVSGQYWIRAHPSSGGQGDVVFGVKRDGSLYCTSATITGAVLAGSYGSLSVTGAGTSQNPFVTSGSLPSSVHLTADSITTGTLNGNYIQCTDLDVVGGTFSLGTDLSSASKYVIMQAYSDSSAGSGNWGAQWGIPINTTSSTEFKVDPGITLYQTYNSGSGTKTNHMDLYSENTLYIRSTTIIFSLLGSFTCNSTSTGRTITLGATNMTLGNAITTNGRFVGTWTTADATGITSDKRVKSEISEFNKKYDILFDNLKPSIFKYDHGTSGRKHSGFIAQDVCRAIKDANLSDMDFAAYIKGADGMCSLRYDEFISLNTWQIQKLKQRVKELEDKITLLENK